MLVVVGFFMRLLTGRFCPSLARHRAFLSPSYNRPSPTLTSQLNTSKLYTKRIKLSKSLSAAFSAPKNQLNRLSKYNWRVEGYEDGIRLTYYHFALSAYHP